MFKEDVDSFFYTPSKAWDERVTFRIKEVSAMTGLPISTLSQMIRDGKIKAAKVGRAWLIKRVDLYKWYIDAEDKSLVI